MSNAEFLKCLHAQCQPFQTSDILDFHFYEDDDNDDDDNNEDNDDDGDDADDDNDHDDSMRL